MDVREKLAGLLNEAGDNVFIVANQPVELQKKRIYEEIADYLIAHGLTVQEQGEWIKNWWNDYSCFICECQLVGHGASNWKYCPHCGAKMMPQPPKGE